MTTPFLPGLTPPPKPRFPPNLYKPAAFKLMRLQEYPLPADMILCEKPDGVDAYYRSTIFLEQTYCPDRENFHVILLNVRRRIIGHALVSHGTLDTVLVHPRDVFRHAIVANAAAVICCHNHPSGDSTPSEADIRVTRDLVRAGTLLKIEVLDHIIIGHGQRTSLREMGYFAI